MNDEEFAKFINDIPLRQRRNVWDEAFMPRINAGIPVSDAVDYANAAADAWERHRPKIPDVQP